MTQNTEPADGAPSSRYKRPAEVDAQIALVVPMDHTALKSLLRNRGPGDAAFIRSETLVYLIREGLRTGNRRISNIALEALLKRCFDVLRRKISSAYVERETLCEDIVGELIVLFAKDAAGKQTGLDYYECKFNHAFSGLRIDMLRTENVRIKPIGDMPKPRNIDPKDVNDETYAKLTKALHSPSNQEETLMLSQVGKIIDQLPSDQRDAVILCRVMGYTKAAAGKRCQCDEGTIRYRLKCADKELAPIMEEWND